MRDPLYKLFELYEQEMAQKRPSLGATPLQAAMAEPPSPDMISQSEVAQKRSVVDTMRAQGTPTPEAHQQAFGEVNTGDVTSKAEFAATMGRVQRDSLKNEVHPDKSGLSGFAKLTKVEDEFHTVTPEDLKTPEDEEVPDKLKEEVLTEETDSCYNDLEYLWKYGNA
jgi:hypothetical protein